MVLDSLSAVKRATRRLRCSRKYNNAKRFEANFHRRATLVFRIHVSFTEIYDWKISSNSENVFSLLEKKYKFFARILALLTLQEELEF